MSEEVLLGIDAGGTFTDFICVEPGPPVRLRVHKTLSTPHQPEQAILQGIRDLGIDPATLGARLHIIHGSTVATNAALEGNLARTAFITNTGIADLLSLGRQTRPALYQLEFPPIAPPVPEDLCLECSGRIAADGSEIESLDPCDLEQLVSQLRDLDVDAVAISMLFSFLDPRHEQAVAAAIKAAQLPVLVSCSSTVLPVYREYERGIATWLNAALGPVVNGYLTRLRDGVNGASLQIMQSNAETVAADKAADAAVNLLLSGPAGGLTAMQFLGEQIGEEKFLSFDMGGTSTDVALLSGSIAITTEGSIGTYPVAVPMVDMHTIGAGGGSIAYLDDGGLLQVGPRSAGADPGPACYGRGGLAATVTDANLVLGRLLATARLAGDLPVDLSAAQQAVGLLAEQLELSSEETALGIVRIATEHMARAIRMISVNRGHCADDFLLASFGGAGGLHVCAVAEAMGMTRAIVPVFGGVLSALGMLAADQGAQLTRTVNLPAEDRVAADLESALQALERQGRNDLQSQGVAAAEIQAQWSAELRYQGQAYTLTVPYSGLSEASSAFAERHLQRYGYCLSNPVEVVNVRVNVFRPRPPLTLPDYQPKPLAQRGGSKNPDTVRVYGHDTPVPVWQRDCLPVNEIIAGPAIVSEYAATTFIAAGWIVQADRIGNLRLQRSN
ncbi:MAG: hydantoinase/oxoprolinase family protein [Pseudohongiellaceae bacterium]